MSVSEDGHDDVDAKIYAISSEGGNVIYHVNKSPVVSKRHISKTRESSVINQKGVSSTAPPRTQSIHEFSFDRVDPNNVKLRVNPFGSESSLDKLIFDGYTFPQSASMPNLKGVKRLNSDTCRKEGIYFDGAEVVEEAASDKDNDRDKSSGDGNVKSHSNHVKSNSEDILKNSDGSVTINNTNNSTEDCDNDVTKVSSSSSEVNETDADNDGGSEDVKRIVEDSEQESLTAEDIAKWIVSSLIDSAVEQGSQKTENNSEEAETSFIIKTPSKSEVEQVLNSASLDNLCNIPVYSDSSSGSEMGDHKVSQIFRLVLLGLHVR